MINTRVVFMWKHSSMVAGAMMTFGASPGEAYSAASCGETHEGRKERSQAAFAGVNLQEPAEMGHQVSGSDLRERPVLERLRAAGVDVSIGHDRQLVHGVDAVTANPGGASVMVSKWLIHTCW